MSGLLKNIDKVVGAQILSAPNKLLLSHNSMRFNQASLYYDPSSRINGLEIGHSYDCFALSTISQALTFESQQFASYLDSDLTEEVHAEIILNQRLVTQCIAQAQILVVAGRWSQETDTSAAIIYAIEQGKRIQKRLSITQDLNSEQLYKEHICPSILKNLKYLSHLNIVDITEGLVQAGYKDSAFWLEFLDHVSQHTFSWEYVPVDFHAWSTDQYEFKEQKKRSFLPTSSTQVQLQYFASTQNSIAKLQRIAQDAFIQAKIGVWLPLLQREKRVQYLFDERDPLTHREDFKSALQQLSESVPTTKSIVASLLKRA